MPNGAICVSNEKRNNKFFFFLFICISERRFLFSDSHSLSKLYDRKNFGYYPIEKGEKKKRE
jgi:hypothetical protein